MNVGALTTGFLFIKIESANNTSNELCYFCSGEYPFRLKLRPLGMFFLSSSQQHFRETVQNLHGSPKMLLGWNKKNIFGRWTM